MDEKAATNPTSQEESLRSALLERYRRERSSLFSKAFGKLGWFILAFYALQWFFLLHLGSLPWWQHFSLASGCLFALLLTQSHRASHHRWVRWAPHFFGWSLLLSWWMLLYIPSLSDEAALHTLITLALSTAPILLLFFMSSQPLRALLLSGALLFAILLSCLGSSSPSFATSPNLSGITFLMAFAYTPLLILAFLYARLSWRLQELIAMREHQHHTMLLYSSDLLMILDREGILVYESPAFALALGLKREERLAKKLLHDIHPDDRAKIASAYTALLARPGHSIVEEIRYRHGDGSWVEMECVIKNLLHDPIIDGVLINARDISKRKAHEQQMDYLSRHDLLTALPHRQAFVQKLGEVLDQSLASKENLVLLLVDLDRFHLINETYGPRCGDLLLQEVAQRLRAIATDRAILSRLSGDEFVLMLQGMWQREEIAWFVQKIQASFTEPFLLMNHHIRITASIGIASAPDDAKRPERLLQFVDQAVTTAKAKKTGVAFFSKEIKEAWQARIQLESELQQAIDRREFLLHYQPRVQLTTGHLHSLEALVRWQHPTRGLIYPQVFIPIAEETGMIHAIGRQILEMACEQLQRWQQAGHLWRVAVNLSARQLQDTELVGRIIQILQSFSIQGGCLELELTESAAVSNLDETTKTLHRLKELGISLSIDDFGTAYSSLNYLKRLPIDHLKIDRSFVKDLVDDPALCRHDIAIIKAIIEIARSLGLSVMAEGIERENQALFLQSLQCDTGQGYLFSRPLDPIETELLFHKATLWKPPLPSPSSPLLH